MTTLHSRHRQGRRERDDEALRPALLVAVILLVSACTTDAGTEPGSSPVATAPSDPTGRCESAVQTGDLPEWARTGFSGTYYPPHVLGSHGDIVAILFGYPLYQPPLADRSNKILWVSRVGVIAAEPLEIEARLVGAVESVHRQVPGGPGSSIIDLPQAGCWQLTLSWWGHNDTLELSYLTPPTTSA
jgi:hypothetical protein